MEVIDHQPGVGQAVGDRGGVGLVGVDHHMADPGQPRRRLRRQPVGDRHGAASRQNIDQAAGVEVDDPGHQQRRVLGGGRQERRLIEPDRARVHRGGRGDRRGAGRGRAPRPSPRARTPRSPGPLGRRSARRGRPAEQISARARSVSTARGAISSDSSDQVRAGQAGSAQRHSRLAHTSTTGRSAIGRSRTTTRRRPWPIARTPQVSHQARSSIGLHRQPPLAARRRRGAGRSRRTRRARPAPTRRYRRVPSGASCRCSRRTAASIARPLSAPVDALSLSDQPTRPHASSRRAWCATPNPGHPRASTKPGAVDSVPRSREGLASTSLIAWRGCWADSVERAPTQACSARSGRTADRQDGR